MMGLFAAKVKPMKAKCGGWTGCEHDHDFYAPEDVLVVQEALTWEDFRACEGWSEEKEQEALAQQTLFAGEKGIVPTMLGMWYEDVSVN
jgi:hypothetical protein